MDKNWSTHAMVSRRLSLSQLSRMSLYAVNIPVYKASSKNKVRPTQTPEPHYMLLKNKPIVL